MQRYDEITLNISLGPDEVEIPDSLRGASEATVRDTLEELGLTVSDVTYVNSATIPRDRLVDTNPALGSTVAYGSTVALKISSGEVEVPDVRGMSEQEARNILTGDDLGLTVDIQEQETEEPEPGTVLDQSAEPGSSVAQGTTITLTISKAPPEEPSPSPSETETPEDEETDSESPTPENDEEDSEAGPSRGWFSNDGQEHGPWNHGIGWGSD